jgi:hypothetical protein
MQSYAVNLRMSPQTIQVLAEFPQQPKDWKYVQLREVATVLT